MNISESLPKVAIFNECCCNFRKVVLANCGLILYSPAIRSTAHSDGLDWWSLSSFMVCTNETRPGGIRSDSLKPSGNVSLNRFSGIGLVFLMFSVYGGKESERVGFVSGKSHAGPRENACFASKSEKITAKKLQPKPTTPVDVT